MVDAIGIDLGTTLSAIACYKNDREDIIPDQGGKRLVPSMVYIDPNTGEISVGNVAYDLSAQYPKNLLRDAKRILGRKFDDEVVTKWIQSPQKMYSLRPDENEKAAFEVTVSGKQVLKTPEEVSAEVLKYLKKGAEDYLGKKIKEAVISIPAYFSNGQRKATKKAAELAGLKVTKLITEPVAAAIHYVKEQDLVSKLMVFDWGGGTLDISFINVQQNNLEVEGVYGDTLLGGRNIDENLVKKFDVEVTRHPEKCRRRLLQSCVLLKEHLSSTEHFNIVLDYYDGENDLSLDLGRAEFEHINAQLFERAIDIVKYGLNDLNYETTDIDLVLLVGGSTRIPKIRKLLSSIFGESKIKTNVHPDEAVAAGACIQAAVLKHDSNDLERYNITEVTPLSLGIRRYGGLFNCVIQRNSKLPVEVTSYRRTIDNNQTSVTIEIYEGERKNCKYNNQLTRLRLEGMPARRAGDIIIAITFTLDEDGILTISASETSTGKRNQLSLTMSEFRLSETKIKFKVEDAVAMKEEDDAFEKFIVFRNTLIQKRRHVLFELYKISSVTDRKVVEDECKQFIEFAENLDFREKQKLEEKIKSFSKSLSPILKKYQIL